MCKTSKDISQNTKAVTAANSRLQSIPANYGTSGGNSLHTQLFGGFKVKL